MQKTANYQLNQWVKSDRIQMEDFNSDNVKIDAALKVNADAITALAKKTGFQLLGTIACTNISTTGNYGEFPLGIDWSQWAEICLIFQPKFSTSVNKYSLFFKANTAYLLEDTTSTNPIGAILYPMFSGGRYIAGHTWSSTAISCSCLYQDADKLMVSFSHSQNPNAVIQDGCTLTVYGRK